MLLSNGKNVSDDQEYNTLSREDAILVCVDFALMGNNLKEWFDYRAPPNHRTSLIGSILIHKHKITYEEIENVCQLAKTYG